MSRSDNSRRGWRANEREIAEQEVSMIDDFEAAENAKDGAAMWRHAELLCLLVADGATLEEAADAIGYGQRGPTWIMALKMLAWHHSGKPLTDPLEAAARCADYASAIEVAR